MERSKFTFTQLSPVKKSRITKQFINTKRSNQNSRTTITFTGTENQKLPKVKPSVGTAIKSNSQLNETETTERKAETGKPGNGGGNPERLMKNAHAYKNEKKETGLNETPTNNERLEKTMCVRVQRSPKERLNTLTGREKRMK